jgi:hypothetical protein
MTRFLEAASSISVRKAGMLNSSTGSRCTGGKANAETRPHAKARANGRVRRKVNGLRRCKPRDGLCPLAAAAALSTGQVEFGGHLPEFGGGFMPLARHGAILRAHQLAGLEPRGGGGIEFFCDIRKK